MTSTDKLQVFVYSDLEVFEGCKLRYFKELIEAKIKEFGEEADFELFEDDGDYSYRVRTSRDETNAEMEKRVEMEKRWRERDRKYRLAKYEELKKEFGE